MTVVSIHRTSTSLPGPHPAVRGYCKGGYDKSQLFTTQCSSLVELTEAIIMLCYQTSHMLELSHTYCSRISTHARMGKTEICLPCQNLFRVCHVAVSSATSEADEAWYWPKHVLDSG